MLSLHFRTGFVANSSASCYLIIGWKLTDEEIENVVNNTTEYTMEDGIVYKKNGEEYEDGIGEVLYGDKAYQVVYNDYDGDSEVFFGQTYYWDEGGTEENLDELFELIRKLHPLGIKFGRKPKAYGRWQGN